MPELTQQQKDAAAQTAAQVKANAEARAANAKEQIGRASEARKQQDEIRKKLEESKPTPTQEENDLAKLGVPIEEHEDDGSGPEQVPVTTSQPMSTTTKQMESGKPAAPYQTRSTQPTPPAPPKPAA